MMRSHFEGIYAGSCRWFIGVGILGHVEIVKGARPLREAQRRESVFHQTLSLEGGTGPSAY